MQKAHPTSKGVPGLAVASQSVQESTAVQLLRDGRELRPWSLVPVVKTPIRFHVHTVNLLARVLAVPPIRRVKHKPTRQDYQCDEYDCRHSTLCAICIIASAVRKCCGNNFSNLATGAYILCFRPSANTTVLLRFALTIPTPSVRLL